MASSKARRRPITQDDLFKARYVTDAVLSPDGRQAAYVLAQTHGEGEKERQDFTIWMVATDGSGQPRQLTRGKGNSYHPRFSPSGDELLFVSTREKVPQIFAMPLDGGEADQLTELPQGAGPFELSPDGRTLVFAGLKAPPAKPDENRHARIDRFWYRFDPLGGYVEDFAQDVYLLRRGDEPKIVSDVGGIIIAASISPDAKRLAILRTGLGHQKIFEADLSVLELKGRSRERTIVARKVITTASWDAAGQHLLCTGPGTDLAYQTSLTVVDATTGQTRDRTRALDLNVGTSLQIHTPVQVASRILPSEDGRGVYATVTRGGEAHVHRISLMGKKRAEQIGEGQRVGHLMARQPGRMLVVSQTFNEPPALFAVDEQTGEYTQLTRHNDRWHTRLRWPDVQRVVVKSARGVTVEGWILKPRHVRAPYKTILNIHGGPHSGYGCSFWSDLHELVGAGYAVAYMNPRGSTGYGDDFSRAILGRWGEPELKDFHAFLDHLVAEGIAHPDRLGVTGISGGGHLSGWLIGHTDRFKAAVPEQGVYSMVSMWGTSDAGRDLIELEMGGELHKIPMTYWRHSPVAHAHKCKTPTLLLQGENDIRCPMEQGEQMFAKLKHHGCEVEFVPMQRCSHGEQMFGRPALRRFRMNVMREWFDRHIR